MAGVLGILGIREDGANLVDASGVLRLLLAGVVVLGVLGKVAEVARDLDALDDLLGEVALAIRELFLELLATFGGKYNLIRFH